MNRKEAQWLVDDLIDVTIARERAEHPYGDILGARTEAREKVIVALTAEAEKASRKVLTETKLSMALNTLMYGDPDESGAMRPVVHASHERLRELLGVLYSAYKAQHGGPSILSYDDYSDICDAINRKYMP